MKTKTVKTVTNSWSRPWLGLSNELNDPMMLFGLTMALLGPLQKFLETGLPESAEFISATNRLPFEIPRIAAQDNFKAAIPASFCDSEKDVLALTNYMVKNNLPPTVMNFK